MLQPTRLCSKTLIDNIFLNSIEYPAYSGNLTVQLSDNLFQFIILEGFYQELNPKKDNISERNFKNFSKEFYDIMKNTDCDNILMIGKNDPNLSMNNLHLHINNILNVLTPYKKLSKKEFLFLMKKRDKLLFKYSKHKQKNSQVAIALYNKYKGVRNKVTKLKLGYYKKFFDSNKSKLSSIWKGIRSIVHINNTRVRG